MAITNKKTTTKTTQTQVNKGNNIQNSNGGVTNTMTAPNFTYNNGGTDTMTAPNFTYNGGGNGLQSNNGNTSAWANNGGGSGSTTRNTNAGGTDTMIAPNFTYPGENGGNGNISNVVVPRHTIDGGNGSSGSNGSGGISGVSSNTQNQLNQYGNGYTAGEGVSAAQAQLDAILNSKPGEYASRYDEQIQGLLTGLMDGSRKFDYNFNDDELFKYYSDLYQNKGRQASMDAMGQAAAMTGGYGNSYAESVAAQANQQYLGQLYDKGMEMRDRAYQMYQDEINNDYNRLNALQNAEQTDYGRYRDTTGDWRTDRDYYTGRTDAQSEQDYNRWLNERNYWNQQAQLENQDYWTGRNFEQSADQFNRNFAENQRQFDANLAQNADQFNRNFEENQRQFNANYQQNQDQYNQNVAINYVSSIIANGQIPSKELLMAAGLSEKDAKKMIQQIEQAAGGGGGGGSTGTDKDKGGDDKDKNKGGSSGGWISDALAAWRNIAGGATSWINNLANEANKNKKGKNGVGGD